MTFLSKKFFFKTKRVFTIKAKFLFLISFCFLIIIFYSLILNLITSVLVDEDVPPQKTNIVIENWSGDIEVFEKSKKVAEEINAKEINSIIFRSEFTSQRLRDYYLHSAQLAGLDTTKIGLIPVPVKEPKTFNIAQAVIDTAVQRGWNNITIVTFELHTSRSKKTYSRSVKGKNITVYAVGIPSLFVTRENWHKSATGYGLAGEELVKRIYYELFVF